MINRTPPQSVKRNNEYDRLEENQQGSLGSQRSSTILRSPALAGTEVFPASVSTTDRAIPNEHSSTIAEGAVSTIEVNRQTVASPAATQNLLQTSVGGNVSPRLESILRLRQLEENTLESCRGVLNRMQQAIKKQKNISRDVQDGVCELREALDVIKHYRQLWKTTESQRAKEELEKIKPTSNQPQAENTPLTAHSKRPATSPAVSDVTKRSREGEPHAWQTVTRRKQKPAAEKELNPDDATMEVTDENQKQDRTKMRKRGKRKPQPRKRLDAVLIKPAEGKSYAEVLQQLKRSVKPEEAEVTVRSVRKTKDGSLLLELLDGGKKKQFCDTIREAVKEASKVTELKPKRTIEIRDLDSLVEQEEIVSAIREAAKKDGADITVRVSNKNSREQCQAFATMEDDIANAILKLQRIKVGWTYCRVRQAKEIKRCFKCFGVGHTQRIEADKAYASDVGSLGIK